MFKIVQKTCLGSDPIDNRVYNPVFVLVSNNVRNCKILFRVKSFVVFFFVKHFICQYFIL